MITTPRSTRARARPAVQRVALLDATSDGIPRDELARAAAALRVQLDRDFLPVWGVRATVVAAGRAARGVGAAWPLRIVDDRPNFGGVHRDARGLPYAEVSARERWSVIASHEMLEMLVDPLGQRFWMAPSVDPLAGGREVSYLVEVCDPVEALEYTIDGVRVSNFVTPAYFGMEPAGPPYDALGALTGPFELPPGGDLSWWDQADGRWHQSLWDRRFITAEPVARGRDGRGDRDVAFQYRRAH